MPKRKTGSESSAKKKRKSRNEGADRADEVEILTKLPPLNNHGSGLYEWVSDQFPTVHQPSMAEEIWRRDTVLKLREHLLRLCGKGTVAAKYPSLSFERWLFSARVLEESPKDVLIPTEHKSEPGLVADLVKYGYPQEKGTAIALALAKAADQLVRARDQHVKKGVSEKVSFTTQGSEIVLISNGITFRLHNIVYDKLVSLYRDQGESGGKLFGGVSKQERCQCAIFKLCLRYGPLGGPGFQAAANQESFASMGPVVEWFASPFNCSNRVFGSAFRDTDAPFGSLGSVFDWAPLLPTKVHKHFEANPPFVPAVIDKLAEVVTGFVDKKGGVLHLIIPAWRDQPFYDQLKKAVDARTKISVLEGKDNDWVQVGSVDRGSAPAKRRIPTPTELWFINA